MISIILSETKRMIGFDKKGFTTAILLGFLTSLLALGYTVSMNYLISALSLSSFGAIIGLFILFAVIVVGRDLLNGIYNYELARHSFTVEGKLRTELMTKVQNLSPLFLERPAVLDKLEKSRAGIDPAIITLMGVEIISANCIVYFIMITVYLCRIHPLLSVVILGTFIPTFISYYAKNKISAEAENHSAPYRRRMNYAESAVCDLEYFKETRHLKAVDYFVSLFSDAANGFKRTRMKEANRTCWINIAVNASYFLGYIAIIAATCYLALTGKIAAGDIAAILVTVSVLISYLTEMFSQYLASIMEAYAGLKNLHEVLLTESDQLQAEDIHLHELHLSEVSFQYPENDRLALDNITLTLHEGETVCIVGENGSGKSTLSKILLGLYPPTKGTVSVNGRKLSSNEFSTLRAVSSSVFQDFNKYALSLCDNISLGSDRIETDMLGDLITQLPDGVNTMLSKAFGGVDLSQGQWQRVAIARGVTKPAQLAVFDEPTAAVDPILESELLEAMLYDDRHKTRIIITHRIGIASKADRVLVLDKGKIVQDGTHQELIQQDGLYSTMFKAQGNWYS